MLPVMLRVENKRVLVVGAGPLALRRSKTLLGQGAQVVIVAPSGLPEMGELDATGQLKWHRRGFEPADLEGAWLVFAHTSSPDLNAEIASLCDQKQIWCLVGGNSAQSDLWMLANRQVGELTLAVSAGGNPKRAKEVLARWEHELPTPTNKPGEKL